jgi:uncharacterized protein YlzI (FlbEa/FlbD family)
MLYIILYYVVIIHIKGGIMDELSSIEAITSTISLLIDGKKYILDVVDGGTSLMLAMNEQVDLCSKIGKTIIVKESIGVGSYGEAFLVEIDDKEYVVKKSEVKTFIQIIGVNERLSKRYREKEEFQKRL